MSIVRVSEGICICEGSKSQSFLGFLVNQFLRSHLLNVFGNCTVQYKGKALLLASQLPELLAHGKSIWVICITATTYIILLKMYIYLNFLLQNIYTHLQALELWFEQFINHLKCILYLSLVLSIAIPKLSSLKQQQSCYSLCSLWVR